MVVSRDDPGDPSLSGRPSSSGGDSNGGPQGRLSSDSFMRTGTRHCSKGLWLKLKMYSDNKLVMEEDENLVGAAPFSFGIGHRWSRPSPPPACHAAFISKHAAKYRGKLGRTTVFTRWFRLSLLLRLVFWMSTVLRSFELRGFLPFSELLFPPLLEYSREFHVLQILALFLPGLRELST